MMQITPEMELLLPFPTKGTLIQAKISFIWIFYLKNKTYRSECDKFIYMGFLCDHIDKMFSVFSGVL